VHEPDADFILAVAHDFRVEEQEGVFNGPVAEEVEYTGG
jgi:hypothetical protein